MTTPAVPRIRNEILAEANRWFIELNESAHDEGTRRGFDAWLRRSPEHLHAFLRASAHWEEYTPRPDAAIESIDELTALARTDRNIVSLDRPARPPTDRTWVVHPSSRESPVPTLRRAAWRWGLAACVLLNILAVLVWQLFFRDIYSTGVGEQYSLTLEDGSTVELNSKTRIRVDYNERERHIELLAGQALFHVAKRQAQPFIVHSGNAQVRAVGTQFDVYRKSNGTVVTVLEGRVAVVPKAASPQSSKTRQHEVAAGSGTKDMLSPSAAGAVVFLDAGQQLSLALDARTLVPARLETSDIEAATAWTQRRLIFKAAPLSTVVSEFNRYSERPMVISDAQLASIPISGVFSSSDPTDLLRFLREVGSYEIRETRDAVEISQAPR